ncbi:MAG: MFS transporter, partial [Dehalococcoidia bacterium]
MAEQRHPIFYGWYVVGGAFLSLFLSFGVLYSFGAFFTPLSKAFDANHAQIAGLFGITLGLGNALGVVSGPLADRIGARWLVAVGAVLIGAGLLVASRADSIWHLYVTYSIGVGLGIACILVPATETVQHWFVRRRGLATGLTMAGSGAGNLAGPPVAAVLLRVWDWSVVFVALGVTAVAGILLASRFLVRAPEVKGLRPDGDAAAPASTLQPVSGMTVREAVKTHAFRLLYLASLVAALGAFVPFAHLVPDAESHGIHPVTASMLLGLIGAGSVAGRFFLGGSSDRFGRRRVCIAMFIGMGLFLSFWLVADNVWTFALFAVGFGLSYGGLFVIVPALTTDYFGARH